MTLKLGKPMMFGIYPSTRFLKFIKAGITEEEVINRYLAIEVNCYAGLCNHEDKQTHDNDPAYAKYLEVRKIISSGLKQVPRRYLYQRGKDNRYNSWPQPDDICPFARFKETTYREYDPDYFDWED